MGRVRARGLTDYKLTIDGRIETYGSTPADHSTSVLGGYAEEFIRTTTGPLFVEFAPAAPHAPATPPPGADASAFADLEPWRPPSYDESDVSDKPGYVRSLPRVDPSGSAVIDAFRIDQYRALRAVDEQVDSLLDALRDTGRLSNTLIVYTSDNGLLWGEHRWSAKEVPYEESIRVPLVVRYDPLGREARDEHRIALNIDLAPTIADVAGTTHPPTDGTSLRPLLTGGNDPWRTDFLIEHMQGANDVPTYCAVRTTTDVLVSYGPSGEREYYDLVRDPYQLRNLAADDDHAARVDELERRLRELCDPLPPGFTTPSRLPLTLAVVAGVGAGALVVSRRRRVMRRDRAVL